MLKEIIKENPRFSLGLTTIILTIIMLVIPLAFFLLLDQKTGVGFGLAEIFFSIVFAILTTIFLLWIRSFMRTRPYLGFIIGLIVLMAFEYGLFLRYVGPYTTTFAMITSLIVLVYFGIFFFKYRKENNNTQIKQILHRIFDIKLQHPIVKNYGREYRAYPKTSFFTFTIYARILTAISAGSLPPS